MFKSFFSFVVLFCLALSGAQAQRESAYDSHGRLIIDAEQDRRDRESGVLQRGGYNPEAAQIGAMRRAEATRPAPSIGNVEGAGKVPPQTDHSIYRCKHNGRDIFADEKGKDKFASCQLVRRGRNEAETRVGEIPPDALAAYEAETQNSDHLIPPALPTPPAETAATSAPDAQTPPSVPAPQPPAAEEHVPCSGAILYKGSTYIFTEHEPCPIPDSLFEQRRPIEADPTYYAP